MNKYIEEIFRIKERSYLSTERFKWLFSKLALLGCVLQSWDITLASLKENKVLHRYLRGSARTKGIQATYRYVHENGIQVITHTTYDPKTGTAKRSGSGWVLLIHSGSERPFFSFELRRGPGFIKRILAVTTLFIVIAENWPKCKQCGELMSLIKVPDLMHMRAFICRSRKDVHRKVRESFWITALPLPQPFTNVLRERFDEFYMYKASDKGKDRKYARVLRSERNRKNLENENKKNDQYGDLKNEKHDRVYQDENTFLDDGQYHE